MASLRHWIPIEKLNLKTFIIYNQNPKAIYFLQNGWHIQNVETSDSSRNRVLKKAISIDLILQANDNLNKNRI